MKKLLSILLALIITLSAFLSLSFAVFAEDADTLAVTVNGVTTNIPVGEKFTYTYTLTDIKILNAEARVNYESSKLAVTPIDDTEEAYDVVFPRVSSYAVCNTDLTDRILYNFSTTKGISFTGEQVLAQFEFTALAAGETTLSTDMIEMVDSEKNYYVDKTPEGPVVVKEFTHNEYLTYVADEEPTEAPTEPVKAEKVSNVTVTGTTKATLTLSWDKVDGAVKYWVYKQMSDGSYACVKSVADTTYTVANLNPGTEYSFKVIYSDANGWISPIASADVVTATTEKAADVEQITGVAGLIDAEISWEPVDGAVKYWIYKAWDENGPFYCYDHTTETSYKVRNLQAATDYYFKVITVTEENGKLVLSNLADAPVLHILTEAAESITVKLDSISKNSATISWPAFENATQYWVKYSNTTKNVNLDDQWLTYDATTETTYTFNNLKPNRTYYFTVVAKYADEQYGYLVANYIAVDTKTLYSDENFFTFEKQENGGLVVSWPEDVNSAKSWMDVYDKDGNYVVTNSTTTNSVSFSFAYDWENCTFALKTLDADSTGRLITPKLGWEYKE
ncbi:MAG: fibronectin type III domain-containing protein [Ruminococcus sp.]|nr:fibronectin type III domain-containing protein [Ruminococcus sp.]